MRYLYLTLIALILSGCADSHQLLRISSKTISLDKTAPVYVSIPRDGQYGHINYAGSGTTVSQIVLFSFAPYFENIETGHEYQSYKDALAHAKNNKYKYLIFPSILAWEDRATEWSGIPDKASIKVAIVNALTGGSIDSVIIHGKSGWATLGGDHPQDLLKKPLDDYAATITK